MLINQTKQIEEIARDLQSIINAEGTNAILPLLLKYKQTEKRNPELITQLTLELALKLSELALEQNKALAAFQKGLRSPFSERTAEEVAYYYREAGLNEIIFPYKGRGRIFVEKQEDIEKIHTIIKDMDAREFEQYLPKDLVGVYQGDICDRVYIGKFQLDLEKLLALAYEQGIVCFVSTTQD